LPSAKKIILSAYRDINQQYRKIMDDESRLDQLNKLDWAKFYPKLFSYTDYLLKNWRKDQEVMIQGYSAEDFVNEAVESFYYGKRTWNDFCISNPLEGIKGAIQSIISNKRTKKESSVSKDIQYRTEDGEYCAIEIEDEQPDVLEMLEFNETIDRVREKIQGDSDLEYYFMCLEDGIYERHKIAETLGKTPDQITAIKKRFQRKLLSLKNEIKR
jgi:hypothetical protein